MVVQSLCKQQFHIYFLGQYFSFFSFIILPPLPTPIYIIMIQVSLRKFFFLLQMCACTMPHTFFYDDKFYFCLNQLIEIPPSSTIGCLPLKVVFHQRSSSTEGCLPPEVVFHQRLSSTGGRLQSKVVFHGRSSPKNLPPNITRIPKPR